jgi:DNA-binding NarL/FixJ family response regulator
MPIRIVLVDDHALVRQGFRRILEDDPELQVAGEQYLSPELSTVLIRAIKTGAFSKSADPYDKLTQREKQVLQLIAHGKSNKEIAVMLDLSVNTVAVHRANLMSALGVHKTAELVLFAVKKGLVLPE